MGIELGPSLLAAILATQVAQLGFEAKLLQRVSKVEVRTNRYAKNVEKHQ